MGVARVGWQPRGFAAKDDGHVEEQLTQSARDDEGIAAVTSPRSTDAARAALRAAGYTNQRVTVLHQGRVFAEGTRMREDLEGTV